MMASHRTLKRSTSSVMLSSTMKMARAPRRRASAMSSMTRGIGKRWKFRPRISMIEQKLQSNVQPREVSTTSIWRPSIVYPESTRAPRFGGARVSFSTGMTGRGGVCRNASRSRNHRPATDDSGRFWSSARSSSRNVSSPSPRTIALTPRAGSVHASGARLGSYPPTTMNASGRIDRMSPIRRRAVAR